jgi:HSP20 family protein
MRQEFARMWDSMLEPRFGWRRWQPLIEPTTWPAVDVFERDGTVVVKADIPGMEAKDIEVSATDDGVTISGHRLEEKEVKEKDYHRSERSYGRFVRQIGLPAGADRSKAVANFKDGVLEITFPLSDGAKQRKIEVKTS